MNENTTIISSRTDLQTYCDNSHADVAQCYGNEGREALVDAIQAADHPAWGTDWAEWLDAHIYDLRAAIETQLDDDADADNGGSTVTTAPAPLVRATLKGGDPNGLRGEDTIWTDLEPCDGPDVWRVLVESVTAAEAAAENTGAELLSTEEWDGSEFGDGAIGVVSSPRPGVLMCRYPDGPSGLPEGWDVYRVASPHEFNGVEELDASDGPEDEETPDVVVRFSSVSHPAITVALFSDARRAAVRWNDGWDWTDIDAGETALQVLDRYLSGRMVE